MHFYKIIKVSLKSVFFSMSLHVLPDKTVKSKHTDNYFILADGL